MINEKIDTHLYKVEKARVTNARQLVAMLSSVLNGDREELEQLK